MAPETKNENTELDELFALIDGENLQIPPMELATDIERRIQDTDRALAQCKAMLVATNDPKFHPDGWRLNIGDAVKDTLAQKRRLEEYRDELVSQFPEPEGDGPAVLGGDGEVHALPADETADLPAALDDDGLEPIR